MNFLSKSMMNKVDKTAVKANFSAGKLVVSPLSGNATLLFPLSFACYKTVTVTFTAKSSKEGFASVGVVFLRKSKPFGTENAVGRVKIDSENFVGCKLNYFIPFGVDEAFVSLELKDGASVTMLDFSADVGFGAKKFGGDVEFVADGGLSAYAPKNSMSSVLAAIRAGFKSVIVDACVSSDGELVAHDGGSLPTSGSGKVFPDNFTVDELKRFDLGSAYGEFYKNVRISTLEEMFLQFQSGGVTPYVRICGNKFPYGKLVGLLEKYGFGNAVVVPRNSGDVIALKKLSDGINFAVVSDYYASGTENAFGVAGEYGDARVLFRANDAEALQTAIKAGEKTIVTCVYGFDGCKL